MSQDNGRNSPDKPGSEMGGFAAAYRKAMPYINSFYVLAAAVAIFGWLGWLADTAFGTKPVLFISGLFLGMISGFYYMYKMLKNLEDQE